MLTHVSLVSMSFGILLSFQCYAMDGVQVMQPERPTLQRTQSMLVLRLVPAHSITDFRKQLEAEQRKQKQTEQEQITRNRKFHEAAGLGTGAKPLRSYSDDVVKQQFAIAQRLLEQGAQIKWGHPLLNLLLAFKLCEEEKFTHIIHPNHARIPAGYGRVQNPTIFGQGHAFVAWLVKNGADVNDVWKEDDTERFTHLETSHYNDTKFERTSDVRGKTNNHCTPLKYALELCKQGCCVKALLDANAQPHTTALYEALQCNPGVARALVEKGASVCEKDDNGNNAVHWAVNAQLTSEERTALLEALHERNVDLRAVNKHKRTPLHRAVVVDNWQSTLREDLTVLEWLLRHAPLVDAQDEHGNTALHLAVSQRSAFYQKSFQEASTYPYTHGERPKDEASALFWKQNAPKQLFEQNSKMVQLLLDGGANPALSKEGGLTALHIAASRGMADCVALLLQHSSTQVNVQDEKLLTPLHHVIMADTPLALKTVIVRQLREAGADSELADSEGNTPLHKAVQSIDADAVDLLLAFGAKPESRNLMNHTPQETMVLNNKWQKEAEQKRIKKALKEYAQGTLVPHFKPSQGMIDVSGKGDL